MIALHHSPIAPCLALGCQLIGTADFLELLAQHPNAKLVLSGHSHLQAEADFRGVRVVTTPSTCAQAVHASASSCSDLDDFWASHSFDQTKHGYRIVDLDPGGAFSSHVHWVANAAVAQRGAATSRLAPRFD